MCPLHTSYIYVYVRRLFLFRPFLNLSLWLSLSPFLPLTLTTVVSYLRRRLSLAALSRNFKDASLCFVIVWTLALAHARALSVAVASPPFTLSLARISKSAATIAFETTKSALKSQSEFGIKQWNF